MPPIRVLILGHSFIRRVHDFLCRNFNARIAKNLSLDGDLLIRWHGIGGRTVSKTREYDLGIVEEFAPNVVRRRPCIRRDALSQLWLSKGTQKNYHRNLPGALDICSQMPSNSKNRFGLVVHEFSEFEHTGIYLPTFSEI